MTRRLLWVALVALVLFLPAPVVLADDVGLNLDGGEIFVDRDISLEPGEVFQGDLGVFNGDLSIPAGSVVTGDVFVTNGDIDLAGRVNGDLAILDGRLIIAEGGSVAGDAFGMGRELDIAGQVGGDLSILFGTAVLKSSAVIQGNLVVLSGTIERDPGAKVMGEQVSEFRFPVIPSPPERPVLPEMPEFTPPVPQVPGDIPVPVRPIVPLRPRTETLGDRIGNFIGRAVAVSLLGMFFVCLGVLISFIWPRRIIKVSTCITVMPVQSFGLGLLTFLIAVGLEALASVLMIVIILIAAALIGTVILIPIGLLLILISLLVLLPVPLVLAGGMVLGWVGLADLLGRKLMSLFKVSDAKPVGAVLVGMLVTVAVAGLFWLVTPICCGWPFVILLTSVGLGAVIHTRFGSQSCRESKVASDADALPLEAMDEEDGLPDTL